MFRLACRDEFQLGFDHCPDSEAAVVVRLLAAQILSAEPELSPERGEDA